MRIERINENSIRCILTSFDLSVRDLNLRELTYGSDKAKKLFEEMMHKANDEVGFNAENTPIMIEAIPMMGNAIQIVITKVDEPEELDTRFSKFSQTQQSPGQDDWVKRLRNEILEGSDGLFQKLKANGVLSVRDVASTIAALRQNAAQQPSAPNVPKKDVDKDGREFRVFAFDELNCVIEASKAIASFDTDSRLYKREGADRYYILVLKSGLKGSDDFHKACNIIAEYGRKVSIASASLAYYEEHYKLIVAEKAIQKLSSI